VPTFDEQMQTDLGTMCSADEFGETVTVTSPAGVATSSVLASYQEYIGAIDEKTQAVFILPAASFSETIDMRGYTITRSNGEIWTVIDMSQRDAAAFNCRAIRAQAVV
jgi:hypothetical protein